MRAILGLVGILLTPPSTAEETPPPSAITNTLEDPMIVFRDVTETSGVSFEHPPAPEKKYILESMSGGVALFDHDLDGKLDLFLVRSQTVETARAKKRVSSAFFQNITWENQLRFTDRTQPKGLVHEGWAMGVCVADVDGNGYPDLYLTGLGRNWLFLNQEGKTFLEASEKAGIKARGWSTGCGFSDVDRDGDLDLFIARYIDMDLDRLPEFGAGEWCKYRGVPVHCGPRGLPGQSDLFYRNNGDGTFTEASKEAGLHDPEKYYGLGVVWFDANADGWPDLFVANDTHPNLLYINQKDGTFEEEAYLWGAAVNEDGKEQGSMGIAVGDPRNQGRPSLFVTNFSEEYNAFYRNQDGQYFSDASFSTQTAAPSVPRVGWGAAFFDADNDGLLDLALVNGHVFPQADQLKVEASAPYRQRRLLFHNQGDGNFKEVLTRASPIAEQHVSRGLAVGDLDGDGRLDLVINNLEGPSQILRNETPQAGHWLMVELRGSGKMRNGIGAKITVQTGKKSQYRWVRSGTSYLSQNDLRQHFGLGQKTLVDVVEVAWPDGSKSRKEKVGVDQMLVIEQ